MGGYQSVLANRQGLGSSGVGFGFVVAEIKELHPDTNICLAQDIQTGDQYQLGLDKRGETAWPQIGDTWLLDRSMGHWALQAKVTDTQAPVFTGYYNTMNPDVLRLVLLLKGMGLIQDGTTTGPARPSITGSRANPASVLQQLLAALAGEGLVVDQTTATAPIISGSKNQITPAVQQIIAALAGAGLVQDQTTAATVPIDVWQTPVLQNGFTGYTSLGDDVTVQYKRNYDNTVTVEGRATPPATSTNGIVMFSLADGFRPPSTRYQTVNVANGICGTITYGKGGDVQLYDFGSNVPTRVLFHMRFLVA